ncbi:alcohol dehydrogenase, zinc-binding domain protein [Luminiphilus syltensis NOR5-1B]|uniref:Alcohol dehydrogenase, zinc-binding domain protein n=1 Tax=Luminiphilus syltensis NOR5-1B TaxID=565045 RepID=B8KSP1_9GAMM|nr:NADP-dependent oxidoreductase [Luminiphilus syltensis]EED36738.1 alcohol dehydrogenase, zinc-binding domain protein [Luminiphilus syltensis NOR5-1B]
MYPSKQRQLVLRQRPTGLPTEQDIELAEGDVKPPQPGDVVIKNLYLSLDPAQRDWMNDAVSYLPPIAIGEAIRSTTLGQVVASESDALAVGDFVIGLATNAWEEYSTTPAEQLEKVDNSEFPLHYHLTILSGAMGLTPYFGMLKLGLPAPGKTVLMSAAAGGVGSIAGQIAKLHGCRVVGIAGADEKCQFICDELGFDDAINYKAVDDLTAAIAEKCPEGIDIYYDNVGGETLDAALLNLAQGARVVFCGAISTYNADGPVPGPFNYWQVLAKGASVHGQMNLKYADEYPAAIEQLKAWVRSGELKFAEHIVEGIENTVDAYRMLFTGGNKGKLIVKIADPD